MTHIFQVLRAFSIFVGEKKAGGCPVTDHFVEVLDPDGQALWMDGWMGGLVGVENSSQLGSDQLNLGYLLYVGGYTTQFL